MKYIAIITTQQIQQNKPITITDEEMTRFIMPMSEAIKLVIYAMKNARNGDIFVKKTFSETWIFIFLILQTLYVKYKYCV